MDPVKERVKIAFAMIETAANAGQSCPSNAEIAVAIGGSSAASGSGVVALLEAMGLIEVLRGRKTRVVTICASGKRTRGNIARLLPLRKRSTEQPLWSDARDATLMEAVAQGFDFEQVAAWAGGDAEQCAARFDELAARFGRQAA